jgi:cobalt-zinc-cadmium efflux system protein
MAADAAGIGLSLLAVIWAQKAPTSQRTFGYERAEILAAVVNAVVLFGLGALLVVEAVRRLLDPGTAHPGVMALFGLVAVAGNAVSLGLLARGKDSSLNLHGAHLEVLSDLLGAAAVLVAAGVIADPLASLLIALLILPRTVRLLREAVDVLLEATPRGVDLDEVRTQMLGTAGVVGVHDLHVWTITSGNPVLSAHVVVEDALWHDGTATQVLDRLGACLHDNFDLLHSTFQLESAEHAAHERELHP